MEESTGVKYSRKWPQKLKIIARNTAGQVGVFLHVFFVLQVGRVDAAQTQRLVFFARPTRPTRTKPSPSTFCQQALSALRYFWPVQHVLEVGERDVPPSSRCRAIFLTVSSKKRN